MPLVPVGTDHAAKMKPSIEQYDSLPLCALVGFFLSHENLYLFSQQAANRGTPPRCQDFGFANRLLGQANCKILFDHTECPRILRVTRNIRAVKIITAKLLLGIGMVILSWLKKSAKY
jgi:hypothetical protein